MDVVDKNTRSRMMSGIKNTNTTAELLIRKGLHRRGFRYSCHKKGIPGTPDLFLKKYNALVFVNGCFWHAHGCKYFKWPSTRKEFWETKINSNAERDKRTRKYLLKMNYRICTIWECSLKGKSKEQKLDTLITRLAEWLLSDKKTKTL
ncbi:MAG: DNA mismatch endonuclease Vsr [Spirochaetales bacterium]|nr:DNA mismatch endonuclease Vsr [Spirochaetales bacterium]